MNDSHHHETTNHRDATTEPGTVWDQRYRERAWSNEPDRLLVDLVSPLSPGTALDLGCGPGRNAVWLARQGWRVTGVDTSRVGLAQAHERARASGVSIETVYADLLSYEATPAGFDLVVMANIHFAEPERSTLFESAARALAREGHLFVVGHHLSDLGRDGPADPERLYTKDRLRDSFPSLVVERLEDFEHAAHSTEPPLVDVVVWATRPTNDERA